MDYAAFLKSKDYQVDPAGFEAEEISPVLYPFQADIVRWALRKGRAAIFAGTGLGKTAMQLEWAKEVCAHAGGDVLIVAPLAVSTQTVREGERFGIPLS